MSEKINEIGALGQIDSLLSQLNDEEINRIFSFLVAKYKIGQYQTSFPQKKDIQKDQSAHEEIPSGISIKDFVNLKKPVGFYERIACLGYYLEKVMGMEGFKTFDITQANKDARLHPMSNPTFFVNDASAKYGFLTPIGSGKKGISAKGEAVVEALPDREKVQQILDENPTKRKAVRKTDKTTKNTDALIKSDADNND